MSLLFLGLSTTGSLLPTGTHTVCGKEQTYFVIFWMKAQTSMTEETTFQPVTADEYRNIAVAFSYCMTVLRIPLDKQKNYFLAGGAISSILLGEPPRDYDIFAVDEGSFQFARLSNKFDKETRYSYSKDDVTLIKGVFANIPEHVVSTFDFSHVKCFATSAHKACIPDETLADIRNRRLRYTGGRNPVNSLVRSYKFQARGWKMATADMLKLAIHINCLDFSEKENVKKLFPPTVEDAKIDELFQAIYTAQNQIDGVDAMKLLANFGEVFGDS
jgi:hypothetical protein